MTLRFLHTLMIILATFGVVESAAAQHTGRDRVLKIDAVALIDQGKEVEGKIDFQQQQGKYNYLFANTENLATFKANPAKYEIQLGGACGRMGALSGEGSPKLFAVHDGKLYIFASEQCRRAFQAGPEKFLLNDDTAPVTTSESLERGRALLDRAIIGLGGAVKLDAIITYREQLSRKTESGGKEYTVTDALTLKPPDGARSDNCWNDQCWANIVVGRDGWTDGASGSESLVDSQRAELLRGPARHPLSLLSQRNNPGFVALSDGQRRAAAVPGEGDVMVDTLAIYLNSAATTLGVDERGRIVFMSYRDRGPNLTIGQVEKTFSAFREINGLLLPGRVDVTFNNKLDADHSGAFVVLRINHPEDSELFKRPVSKN